MFVADSTAASSSRIIPTFKFLSKFVGNYEFLLDAHTIRWMAVMKMKRCLTLINAVAAAVATAAVNWLQSITWCNVFKL